MNDVHPSGGKATPPSSTPPINNGQQPVTFPSQQQNQFSAFYNPTQQQISNGFNNNVLVNGVANSNPIQPSPQNVISNSDDIILTKPTIKKSIKPFLIVIGLILVVLAGLGVCFFIVNRNNSKIQTEEVSKSFESFANYLLFERISDEPIDANYYDDTLYALDCNNKTKNECNDFFKEANALLDNFLNSNYKEIVAEEYIDDINYYVSTFKNYYTYIITSELSDDDILNYYIENGYEETLKYISDYYSSLVNAENDLLISYGNYLLEKADVVAEIINEANQAGCLEGDHYNQGCISDTLIISDRTAERFLNIEDNDNYSNIMIRQKDDLTSGTFYISKILSGKEGENEEN